MSKLKDMFNKEAAEFMFPAEMFDKPIIEVGRQIGFSSFKPLGKNKDVKVGDSLYTVNDSLQILEYEVIRIDGDRIYASKGDDKCTEMLVCNEDNIGKSVFRSIEEAEQALSKLRASYEQEKGGAEE